MRRREANALGAAVRRFAADPARNWPIGVALLVVVLIVWWASRPTHPAAPAGGSDDTAPVVTDTAGQPGDYLFCFWNVENLFDDQEDRRLAVDRPYDTWFARDAAARTLKYRRLSEALVKLNDGRGPDILACVEVESVRAAELLRDALNDRIPDKTIHYRTVLMKEVSGGRHIAPAIITRLSARPEQTRLVGPQLRILEGHIDVNGADLTVLATHWTSHVSDDQGGRRDRYADLIYRAYRDKAARDPNVDVLICGDFNDPPDSPGVTDHLHATGDRDAVLRSRPDLLLDLMAGKDPNRFGTHYYHSKLLIYDQIVVAPGMLDAAGWSCDPDSVMAVNTLTRPGSRVRAPWRFGNEKDSTFERGYSDHFPVTVRLKVQGGQ
ncbi:MAG TPA: endonuclease/exonuclease/phosphatase family protein [Gemmataceae bacterium]|jgi:endonuclease/exonuclease/phosphatase family metal-dependent hydrolase